MTTNNNQTFIEDDVITIATTSDCSIIVENEPEPSLRPWWQRENVKATLRLKSFWFFIFTCVLLVLSIIFLPILLNHREYQARIKSMTPLSPPKDNDSNENNNNGISPPRPTPPRPTPPGPTPSLRVPTPSPGPTIDPFDYILEKNLITDPSLLKDKFSPQYQAAEFMGYSRAHTKNTEIEWKERYAMAVFYYHFGGDLWKYFSVNYNFMSPFHSVCEWHATFRDEMRNTYHYFGAVCNAEGRVSEIYFWDNRLVGMLEEFHELTLWEDLRILFLVNDPGIIGNLPAKYPPNLEVLLLSDNNLSGSIPETLPASLKYLGLDRNKISSSLPDSWCPPSLAELHLEENYITGRLDSLQECTELRKLYLGDNLLEHTLEEKNIFTSLASLITLDLSDNPGIEGQVSLQWPSLRVLDLHGTSVQSFVASSSSSSSSSVVNSTLEFLALFETPLQGTFPSAINFPNLTHLDVTSTKLKGDMSSILSSMTNLEYLFLAHTKFNAGPIPKALLQLTNLVDVSLQNSQRTGSIPIWKNMTNTLILLDYQNNDLAGTIPPELFSEAKSLEYVLLSKNRLNGAIPQSVGEANELSKQYCIISYESLTHANNKIVSFLL